MRVSYLQHVPFEDLAAIEPWLAERQHCITPTRLFAGEKLPATSDFDWLIVMGGPMGANDDRLYAWLHPEKALIKAAIDEGKTVLGICLGAQLIAAALGARVYPNSQREIGWFPITRTTDAIGVGLGSVFPSQCDVFHWHGDTFDLPPGTTRLASSEACLNQAFCMGDKILGLQFHLETTPQSASRMISNLSDELASGGGYVQTSQQILSTPERFDRANELMAEALSTLAFARA